MKVNNVYDLLKNITLADMIRIVVENGNIELDRSEETEVYYTANELIAMYPNILSKYKLAKYIKEENFPVIKSGKERFFPKKSVEQWLENKSNQAMFRSV